MKKDYILILIQSLSILLAINFKIIGKIESIEIIAVSKSIDDLERLVYQFGKGRWRKMKGVANVTLSNGSICKAEIHWYEAHDFGKKKIKRFID